MRRPAMSSDDAGMKLKKMATSAPLLFLTELSTGLIASCGMAMCRRRSTAFCEAFFWREEGM